MNTKSLQDMDRLYRTANHLFKTSGYNAATVDTAASNQEDDVRTIIGKALNRK